MDTKASAPPQNQKGNSTPLPSDISEKEGYNTKWLVRLEDAKYCLCGLCTQVARDIVELSCKEHAKEMEGDDDDEKDSPSLLFCRACLARHLARKNNKCPVGGHSNPSYHRSLYSNRSVQKLNIKCPNEVARVENELGILNLEACGWTGTIQSLKKHLPQCTLRSAPCKFVEYGCKVKVVGGNDEKHNKKSAAKHAELLCVALLKRNPVALVQSEKKEEKEANGFALEYLTNPRDAELLLCGNCAKVARDAVELACDQHFADESESDDENEEGNKKHVSLLFCKRCLENYIQKNKNRCPVGNHPNPTYHPNLTSQKQVSRLNVECPFYVDSLNAGGWVFYPFCLFAFCALHFSHLEL